MATAVREEYAYAVDIIEESIAEVQKKLGYQ